MQNSSTNSTEKYKIVFLGDEQVGKTSVVNRFVHDDFNESYNFTVGIDFISKACNLENKEVGLQLWDTAGKERFRSLIPSYIKNSKAAIIVYDITNKNSFNNVTKWVDEVKELRGNEQLIFIVGNKSDRMDRSVYFEDGQSKAKELGCFFQEVSSKTGENIITLFQHLSMVLSGDSISDPSTESSSQIDKKSNSFI